MICFYCHQYENSISFFRKALIYSDNNPLLYYNLANVYNNIEEYKHAKLMVECAKYITNDVQLLSDIEELSSDIPRCK